MKTNKYAIPETMLLVYILVVLGLTCSCNRKIHSVEVVKTDTIVTHDTVEIEKGVDVTYIMNEYIYDTVIVNTERTKVSINKTKDTTKISVIEKPFYVTEYDTIYHTDTVRINCDIPTKECEDNSNIWRVIAGISFVTIIYLIFRR